MHSDGKSPTIAAVQLLAHGDLFYLSGVVVDDASYIRSPRLGGGMTKDQMRDEHDRLQRVLEAHEARAAAGFIPDHHDGLRQRIAGLATKLAETNVA